MQQRSHFSRVALEPNALPEGLAPDQLNWVKEQLALFIASWKAHGASLEAGFEIIENRFIILYVNESGQIATGCSIDESIAFIKGLSSVLKVNMMDRSRLFFRKKGSNEIVEMNFFEAQKADLKQVLPYGRIQDESSVNVRGGAFNNGGICGLQKENRGVGNGLAVRVNDQSGYSGSWSALGPQSQSEDRKGQGEWKS